MVDRRTTGSWLEGPASVTRAPGDYPGRRLGLPEQGAGSIGRVGRRFVALCVDWFLALLLARVALQVEDWNGLQWATLAVFTLLNAVLLATVGGTVGHRLLGLKLVRLDGTEAGPARGVARAVLLSLAVPALIWDRDQRGMHDRLVGTVLRRV
ncbi:MAG TPA: RDD family protein [Actinomycetales bacterium]|jgi:uncharacterized RDD family membrane protein YckC|nr:RDD family protein [Actinomycetales bacterium]